MLFTKNPSLSLSLSLSMPRLSPWCRATHCNLQWLPLDRARRCLMLRYQLQTMPPHNNPPITDAIKKRLSPETRELIGTASIASTKQVARQRVVTLSCPKL